MRPFGRVSLDQSGDGFLVVTEHTVRGRTENLEMPL
jgi:hypothetical protein